jgi:ferrochelatase
MIIPKRAEESARLYQKIWSDRGSPLLYHTLDLCKKTQELLGSDYLVRPAMRYGKPSIRSALENLSEEGIKNVCALPLYPQYSLAATETAAQELRQCARELGTEIEILPPFYDAPQFIDSVVAVAKRSLQGREYDRVLFSYHGLPERQVRKTDPSRNHCLTPGCCDAMTRVNRNCYRAQCYETTRQIAQRLRLGPDKYTVSFQSRLGRTPWIKPFTDELYKTLPKQGVKKLAVICPSFVADCLETVEEVQIRGLKTFKDAGGEDLFLIPCVNSDQSWAVAVAEMIKTRGGTEHSRLPKTGPSRTHPDLR